MSAPLGVGGGPSGNLGHTTGLTGGVGGLGSPKITKKDRELRERPASMPLVPSPQMMNALRATLPASVLPATIVEGVATGSSQSSLTTGVPLYKSQTMDSTISEDRGRRKFKRSSGPFNIFRSRSRNTESNQMHRDPSPAISALRCSDYESDADTLGTPKKGKKGRASTRVRNSAFEGVVKDDEDEDEGDEEESNWSEASSDEDGEEDEDDELDNGCVPNRMSH